jgi:hypothetical protein
MISKIKSVLGYMVAALMLPAVVVTLIGMGSLAETLVGITGMVISPWYTGGEVARTIQHEGYETRIHRPVFDAIIGERREGFMQVVWTPKSALPETLIEDIDINEDGQPDFQVTLHPKTKTAEWRPYGDQAYGMEGPYEIGEGMGVRIKLKK